VNFAKEFAHDAAGEHRDTPTRRFLPRERVPGPHSGPLSAGDLANQSPKELRPQAGHLRFRHSRSNESWEDCRQGEDARLSHYIAKHESAQLSYRLIALWIVRDLSPDMFHDSTVRHAAWAGSFAGTALQTQVPVLFNG
jgi:hypothetical protein